MVEHFADCVLHGRPLRYPATEAAANVAVDDQLPAGLTFVAARPSIGTFDASSRRWTVGALAAGGGSLAIMPITPVASYVGGVAFVCVLVILNIVLVMNGVVQERKDKVQLFILSLPVSTTQYTTAKVIANVIALGAPALTSARKAADVFSNVGEIMAASRASIAGRPPPLRTSQAAA